MKTLPEKIRHKGQIYVLAAKGKRITKSEFAGMMTRAAKAAADSLAKELKSKYGATLPHPETEDEISAFLMAEEMTHIVADALAEVNALSFDLFD